MLVYVRGLGILNARRGDWSFSRPTKIKTVALVLFGGRANIKWLLGRGLASTPQKRVVYWK
jgi:hypothetical protein